MERRPVGLHNQVLVGERLERGVERRPVGPQDQAAVGGRLEGGMERHPGEMHQGHMELELELEETKTLQREVGLRRLAGPLPPRRLAFPSL